MLGRFPNKVYVGGPQYKLTQRAEIIVEGCIKKDVFKENYVVFYKFIQYDGYLKIVS